MPANNLARNRPGNEGLRMNRKGFFNINEKISKVEEKRENGVKN